MLNEAEKELLVTAAEKGVGAGSEDNDDMDCWVDEMEELDAEEHAAIEESVLPVQLVLVKAR